MNRYIPYIFSTFILIVSLSCSPRETGSYRTSLESKLSEVLSAKPESQVSFEDRTEEIVGHAERLIEKNDREGAVLDERWYTLKRFGNYQDVIFSAGRIIFYGGRESDMRAQLQDRYASLVPAQDAQEPGDIRLFLGARRGAGHDLIIIGQNGREVALKTIIRLLYLPRFADDAIKRKYPGKLTSFKKSLKVFMSSHTARQEFITFLQNHGISRPEALIIGFVGVTRTLIRDEGLGSPLLYSDESLRVNWYANVNGMKVLLVSINHNRIFASRSGELVEAILQLSGNDPPSIVVFLGIGGAIDGPELVGQIVNPTIVLNGDPFPGVRNNGGLVHIIRNRAVDEVRIRTAHVSVESVIAETRQWAAQMKKNGVRTVDQELFHIMSAVNASSHARKVELFVGILVTDNVSSKAGANRNLTLQHAEEIISETSAVREQFMSKVLTEIGILKGDKTRRFQQKTVH